MNFNVRKVLTPSNQWGYLFGRAIKLIKAKEELLQDTIVNIESNKEFIVFASIKIMSSLAGAMFSISHSRRKLLLFDLSTKGVGDRTKLILRYRSTNDTMEAVVFKDVAALGDRKYHVIILQISDVIDGNGKKISSVTLYVDCKPFGKVETVSPISSIFSYQGTLLSRLDFRIGQRGLGSKVHTKWMVSTQNFSVRVSKRRVDGVGGGGGGGGGDIHGTTARTVQSSKRCPLTSLFRI